MFYRLQKLLKLLPTFLYQEDQESLKLGKHIPITIGIIAKIIGVIIKRYDQQVRCDQIKLLYPSVKPVTEHRPTLNIG